MGLPFSARLRANLASGWRRPTERGSLGFRELSCRVTRDMTALIFPLEGEAYEVRFTFEYETSKPGLPVDLRFDYTNGRDGVERETSHGEGREFLESIAVGFVTQNSTLMG